MEKIKRFVVLPLGLLIINLALALYRNPWGFLSNHRLDFWQKSGYFLRGLSGCAAYIFLIALLFTFVFTRVRVSELFKKPALKAMGIVLAAELAIRLPAYILKLSGSHAALEMVKHGTVPVLWYSVFTALPGLVVHIAVLYFTLRLLLKPLGFSFTFRKSALFITLLIYNLVSVTSSYFMAWLTEYLNATGHFTLDSANLFGVSMSMDGFYLLFSVVSNLVSMLLDLLIFEYFHRCIKVNGETAPALNPINN